MKRMASILMALVLAVSVTACGSSSSSAAETTAAAMETSVAVTTEEAAETVSAEDTDEEDYGLGELEMIGNVEVENNLFDVVITIPEDFVGETTQEELDETAKTAGYQSAVLNDDGSVTYTMTKAQHNELMDAIKESLNESLSEMIGSEDYPDIVDITVNDDYTEYRVTTRNEELSFSEAFSVLMFYTCSGMYGVFNGTPIDNVHVDFINADSGEIIDSVDSADTE